MGTTLGNELLKIHKSYLPVVDNILEKDWLHSISHITGGGIVENTNRVIGSDQKIKIDWDSWNWPPIFKLIMEQGNVPIDDMRRSFNLGLGLILIIDSSCLDILSTHMDSLNQDYRVVGEIY